MRRLRPLTEAECYARCYGTRDDFVRVVDGVAAEPRRVQFAKPIDGERLRRLFEERLEARAEAEAA